METQAIYNPRSPAVKRLMREAVELKDPADEYFVQPLEDNLFEWHFTINGPPSTEFEGGIYHGRIVLPTEYPMKPPNIIILTPNGRFETNKSICLSISGHHPETWQPSWSIRTALLALIAFMPSPGKGMIGALDYTVEERKTLARKSRSWRCPICGDVSQLVGRKTGAATRQSNEVVTRTSTENGNIPPLQEIQDGCFLPCKDNNEAQFNEQQQEVIPSVDGRSDETGPSVISHVMTSRPPSSEILKSYAPLSIIIALIALLVFRRIFLL
ncbi:ubiquitin-conjugating enzyme E2 J1-like [Ischnura elegans]|uniref:ubiquitin-conjugating enzyme E2 J1-like n=1 Tax=Ischnura elegans TaxID=197161 RepID=UPI001ED8670E|nr:ubiquitin-conjugating enzyme E2 J1-like [Ischnura elegans]